MHEAHFSVDSMMAGSFSRSAIGSSTWPSGPPNPNPTAFAASPWQPPTSSAPPSAPEPADFDRFWGHAKARLARVAMDPILQKSDQYSTKDATVYKISLGNIAGSRLYGWIGIPTREGRFPAILTVPAAGVYATPAGWTDWTRRGFIAMGISAHDYDCDMPKETYDQLNAGPLKGYPFQGRQSAQSFYFMRVFLSCVRSIDYLTSRPEWDGENVVVTGSSQGGGLSIISAGLDPRVTAIAANVPALCDHTGALVGRQAGWPRLIPSGDELAVQRVTRVSQYFDAVNFARRIKCPTAPAHRPGSSRPSTRSRDPSRWSSPR